MASQVWLVFLTAAGCGCSAVFAVDEKGDPWMNKLAITLAAGLVAGASAPAQAGVVFSDNFNSYAFQLNWVPPMNWTVPVGTVDLTGETTTITNFDFFPGNGGYVDLDGSSGQAGTLATIQSFAAGTYKLTFDLAGNARGDVDKTTTISLGNFSTMLDLPSTSPYQLFTFTFTTTGGTLSFADNAVGNQDIGNILDNVTLTSVPEASTWVMMLAGFAGLGLAGFRRSRKGGISVAST